MRRLPSARPLPAGRWIVAAVLIAFTFLGAWLRLDAAPKRYPPRRHQMRDVHRYYVSPAQSFLAGRGWTTNSPHDFIPPPLQGVFVLLVKLADPQATWGTVRHVQAWLSVLAIPLAFGIGIQIGGAWTGAVAAGLIAVDPDLVDAVSVLLAESNYLVLLFAFLSVLLLAVRRRSGWLMAASGALLGLTSLAKAFPALLSVLIPVYLVARSRSRSTTLHAVVFFLAFCAVVAPWTIRNHLRYGGFALISTNGGTALASANFATLDSARMIYRESYEKEGAWRSPEIEERYAGHVGPDGRRPWNETDRAYLRHALRYVAAHPLHFLRNYGIKLYNVFRYAPPMDRESWVPAHRFRNALVVLGLPGFFWFAFSERRRPQVLLAWIFAYFTFFLALFYISETGRIQLPTKVLLTFFAAYAIVRAVESSIRRADPRITGSPPVAHR